MKPLKYINFQIIFMTFPGYQLLPKILWGDTCCHCLCWLWCFKSCCNINQVIAFLSKKSPSSSFHIWHHCYQHFEWTLSYLGCSPQYVEENSSRKLILTKSKHILPVFYSELEFLSSWKSDIWGGLDSKQTLFWCLWST